MLCLQLAPGLVKASDYAARIEYAELQPLDQGYTVRAHIDYRLSPTAKEALHKGVRLTWEVTIELRQPGALWDTIIHKHKLTYSLQFHALLNQYVVQTPFDRSEMFLTLSAAMNFMAAVHDSTPIPAERVTAGTPYLLAVKTQFNREQLPIPLRPVAYLDNRWFLSSAWYTWPIQK
ncbi:DUF4390 domain-containing protein [Methylomonas sp. MO1]|uniref:DUF4390 domain-containing protein n=1 Tax=Methylomonas sp. MO1 TaxID=3073619 RepID=UPI0028A57C9C|nr:DUF4390 domain-containing protein [Methylomonas sp. MO1]MDT4288511.1 DUF4390 domain-containing protein [Methylomonas sp. MO1]